MPATLLVPDLLPPADAPAALRAARLPALERWLAKADIARDAATGAEGWLAQSCGRNAAEDHAPIALRGEGFEADGAWLHADPVHLRVQRDNLALHEAAVLQLLAEESGALVAALQDLFGADGLRFAAPDPGRWYVQVPAGELPAATPLEAVSGRNIFGLLPKGTGRINWGSALTEAQMLLGAHPANDARRDRGEPEANGVWFWGGGTLPARTEMPFSTVLADSPYAIGLARIAGTPSGPVPPGPGDPALLDNALVILGCLSAPLRRADVPAWLQQAAALDGAWFSQLDAIAARCGGLRLVLPAAEGTRVATSRAGAPWRWFRARKPLAAYA